MIVAKGANTIEAEFGFTNDKSVNFFLGKGERQVTSFVDQLIARSISGLNFGLMLALASIGLSLIYGTTGLANFAHAEIRHVRRRHGADVRGVPGLPAVAGVPARHRR